MFAPRLLLPVLLLATLAFAAGRADVKVGTAVEKYEVTGVSDSFRVAPGTRLYVGTRVVGVENDLVSIVFVQDGVERSKTELKVPRSPYRTHAYRTFRDGDSGTWAAKILGPDGAELGSARFAVTVTN